ncbi:2-phosphosulfolactate phosphatase [Planctomicrobium sp. SH527]|uniref:2-phosphosulfolactate phosphatase n=1 Tax=Planctomicrobium sp. SH527 TaxID=3448123 RepID=UPI003F5B065D
MPKIHTYLLPSLAGDVDLSNATCVVIDILRASTTIVHALANGASAVFPCLNVDEALQLAHQYPPDDRILGGERHGQLIPGFDLDNSPFSYSTEAVHRKPVLFTTTNGTKALWQCRTAKQILIGAFVNQLALTRAIEHMSLDVHLFCAGTDGQLTSEDILFAGFLTHQLLTSEVMTWEIGNLQAQLAADFYQVSGSTPESFKKTFEEGLGAQNLFELGMDRDIARSMEKDVFACVPHWNPENKSLTPLHASCVEN